MRRAIEGQPAATDLLGERRVARIVSADSTLKRETRRAPDETRVETDAPHAESINAIQCARHVPGLAKASAKDGEKLVEEQFRHGKPTGLSHDLREYALGNRVGRIAVRGEPLQGDRDVHDGDHGRRPRNSRTSSTALRRAGRARARIARMS